MTRSINLTLGGREYEVARARLGQYLALHNARERIENAVEAQDTGAIADGIFAYLSEAVPELPRKDFEGESWLRIADAYLKISDLNRIPEAEKFAIIRRVERRRGRSVPWDYLGRNAVSWIHIIASAYGWSKDEIESLWPEEAISFVQEILVDQQIDREFRYSLSQVAYKYDKASKKSRFVPMPRPAWMVMADGKVKKTKLHKSLLPVGEVVYPKGTDDETRINHS